jgi:hypothetical protein
MHLMAHLSRWLAGEGLDALELTTTEVERFLAVRRAAGYAQHLTDRAMEPMLTYLRGLGVAPVPAAPVAEGPVEIALERYRHYLTVERGLGNASARGYVDAARPFLRERVSVDGLGLDVKDLSAADVTVFIVETCPGQGRGTAKRTVTALRSLLKFLHVEGSIERPLAAAIPSVAGWRLAGLPKGLEPEQVECLLASCDRHTSNGRRDFAILITLVRLGLRAGEVAGLLPLRSSCMARETAPNVCRCRTM